MHDKTTSIERHFGGPPRHDCRACSGSAVLNKLPAPTCKLTARFCTQSLLYAWRQFALNNRSTCWKRGLGFCSCLAAYVHARSFSDASRAVASEETHMHTRSRTKQLTYMFQCVRCGWRHGRACEQDWDSRGPSGAQGCPWQNCRPFLTFSSDLS